jgi:hypothetical protein
LRDEGLGFGLRGFGSVVFPDSLTGVAVSFRRLTRLALAHPIPLLRMLRTGQPARQFQRQVGVSQQRLAMLELQHTDLRWRSLPAKLTKWTFSNFT